jgi:hypothetical protein
MRSRVVFTAAIAALFAALAGCGSTGRHPVSGKVLYNGQPAVGASVTFVRKGAGAATDHEAAQGVVQDDGTFTLAGPTGKGAPPGEYIVLVEWKEGAGKVKGRSPGLNAPDRLKKRYLDPNKPLLTATVETKTTQLPPFELK